MVGKSFQNLKIKWGKLRKRMPAGKQVGTAGLHQNPGSSPVLSQKRCETSGERGPALGNPLPRAVLKFHCFIYVPM